MHRSVGAIIRKDGKILMLDRVDPPFGWACSCGHVEEGEDIKEALKRETMEETGLKIKDFKLIAHEFVPWNECKRGEKGHDFFIYEILDWTGEVKNNYESKKIDWFSSEDIKLIKLEEVWQYFVDKLNLI
jgi:ADP-ribose pyrophosphatase YjhB (NUDIX family)